MANNRDLIELSAQEAVELLLTGHVSPLELVEAAIARIEEVDGAINALPIRCYERAREQARSIMAKSTRHEIRKPGWLGGLPVAIKDYNDVSGVRTTHGSPIFANAVARESDNSVKMLERSGAIPVAKSNVPEFAGTHTFNRVFGATLNPWNTALSAGGSSGGSAAALATGMVWLATGSDLGGSLRTPASFCSVVGLRPSPGRVSRGAGLLAFDTLIVEGSMARTVGDVALMLDAQVEHCIEDPLSLPPPTQSFQEAARRAEAPGRVAFSKDLGIVPVDAEVADLCLAATTSFEEMGAVVEEKCPDFRGVQEIFHTLRAILFASMKEPLLREHREQIMPDIVWNIEKGLSLSASDIAKAERERAELYHRVAYFFSQYDVLVCPTAIVPPFPAEWRYPQELGGEKFATYIDWIANTFAITLTSCPALSLPCGFTEGGLPVGLQLVGKPRGEAALISAARALEATLDLQGSIPTDPVTQALGTSL